MSRPFLLSGHQIGDYDLMLHTFHSFVNIFPLIIF
jgi:hypothetical protein